MGVRVAGGRGWGGGLGDLQSLSRGACGQAGGKAAEALAWRQDLEAEMVAAAGMNTRHSYRPSKCHCV